MYTSEQYRDLCDRLLPGGRDQASHMTRFGPHRPYAKCVDATYFYLLAVSHVVWPLICLHFFRDNVA